MRLVLITRRYWPLVGGGEVVMANLASEFQRQGCSVTVLTARWEKHWPVEIVHRDVKVVRLANSSARAWGTYQYMRGVTKWLRENAGEFDAVLVSMLKHDAYAALSALSKSNVPVIVRAEGGGETGDCRWHETGRFGMKIRKKMRQAKAIIAPSDSISQELYQAGFGSDQVNTIYNGVCIGEDRIRSSQGDARANLAEAHPVFNIEPMAPLVVFTGRLHQGKGLSDLIDAWPIVLQRWPEAKLWLVGEGEDGVDLWRRVEGLNLVGAIVFPGSFDDLSGILHAADTFVLPSYEEGMSVALLEAMEAGVPVIATDIVGNRKLVQHEVNGILTSVRDPQSLAQAILRNLEDRSNAQKRALVAREMVKQEYSLTTQAQRHLKVIQSCIEENKARPTRENS